MPTLFRRRSAMAAAAAALLAVPALALADNVQNDVVIGGNDTITVGGSTSISYRITATGGGNDTQQGCNADDGTSATLTINRPSAVVVSGAALNSAGKLVLTACGNENSKAVTFSASAPGDYPITVSVADSGGGTYTVDKASFVLKVAGKSNQSITFNKPADRVYGDAAPVLDATATSNLAVSYSSAADDNCSVNGSSVTLDDAGTCTITATQPGNDAYNAAAPVTRSFAIAKKRVHGSFTAASRAYDGTTAASVGSRALVGTLPVDVVSLSGGSAAFATETVGTDKPVVLSGASLSGADAGNYSLSGVSNAKADITPLGVIGSFTATDKVYDRSADATVLSRSVSAIGDDALTLTGGTATFSDRNAGTDKPVSLAGASLSGPDAGNYTLSSVADAQASITPAGVTGSWSASDKVYDGDTAASIASRDLLSGVIAGDTVFLTGGSASFADERAGTDKTVTGSGFGLGGTDASNYQLDSINGNAEADITPKTITAGITAADKVYDGGTAAALTGRPLAGDVPGDDVALTGGSASFADRHVGEDKPVTLTGAALTGDDAGNYTLGSLSGTTGDIHAATITGTITAESKTYDGTSAAQLVARTVTAGKVGTEDVSISGGSASFDTKDVGTDKPVTGTGFTLAGDDKGNYTLGTVTGTTADIVSRAITITADAKSKDFGQADPALTWSVTTGSVATGDSVTGLLTRVSGETKGQYDIEQSTLSAGSNYKLTYRSAKLTINGWALGGFFAPVDKSKLNSVKVGSAVPLKFTLGGNRGTDQTKVFAPGYPKSLPVACDTGSQLDAVEQTVTAGSSSLQYDAGTLASAGGQYTYVWKTDRSWTTGCRQLVMAFVDGSELSIERVNFKLTK